MLKERYSAFNAAVERIYTHQSGWTIPDASLRAAVKRVIKDDLLPPYSDFLRRCGAARQGARACRLRSSMLC